MLLLNHNISNIAKQLNILKSLIIELGVLKPNKYPYTYFIKIFHSYSST